MVALQEIIIKNIMNPMAAVLQQQQLAMLDSILRLALHEVDIVKKNTELSTYCDDNIETLKDFASSKKIEGSSDKTIKQYVMATRTMLLTIDKNFKEITTSDIKYYLALYQSKRKVSQTTIANLKRFISAFYTWAEDEGYVTKNPVRAIKNIKQVQKEKEFLTEDEVAKMREACKTTREKAMLEFLISTGCRVSEFVSLNKSDVDLEKGTVRIYATKTRSYRVGYLTAGAKLYLRNYLLSRDDSNEALFVEGKGKHRRLGNSSVQHEVQRIAKRAAVTKHVTVHIFRKTLATTLSKHGVDIVIIKELLGHADISVTVKNYASMDQENIRIAHARSVA